MRIESIREFVAVAEKGNFSLAARSLNISQPALSNHIKALEKELRCGPLLSRAKGSNGAVLTRAGRMFYEDMTAMLAHFDSSVERVAAIKKEMTGRIRVALSPISPLCNARMVELVRAFSGQCPSVDVQLAIDLPNDLIDALDKGDVDCAVLVQRVTPDASDYPAVPLCEEEVCALMPDSHPLAACDSVPVREMARYPQVHRAHGNFEMTERFQKELFGRFGVVPEFTLRANSSLDDFIINEIRGSDVVISPESFRSCGQFQLRPDLLMKPFDPPLMGQASVIFGDLDGNEALGMLYEFAVGRA